VLGLLLAATYDLIYLAVPLAVVFLVARIVAGHIPSRTALALPATWRLGGLIGGFLTVFVPTRIWIWTICRSGGCYAGSDLRLDGITGQLPKRALTGAPVSGWNYVFGAGGTGDRMITDVATSPGTISLALLIIYCGRRTSQSPKPVPCPQRDRNLANGLAIFGAGLILFPALLASTSGFVQRFDLEVGQSWRESPLSQLGCLFLGLSLFVLLYQRSGEARRSGLFRAQITVLTIAAIVTLGANAKMAQMDRADEDALRSAVVSTAVLYGSDSASSLILRCHIAEFLVDDDQPPEDYKSGPKTLIFVNKLAYRLHEQHFCNIGG
jgi:hypothetical protein